MPRKYEVVFEPEGKRALVPENSLLLDAVVRAGVRIETPCGGQGRCGRCWVKTVEGSALQKESSHLTRRQIEEGVLLCCQARVISDLVVTVPPLKERDRAIIEAPAGRGAVPITLDWPLFPEVRQQYLEISPPSLDDNAADLERLRRAIERELEIPKLSIPLSLLSNLSGILRQDGWKVTVAYDLGLGTACPSVFSLRPGRAVGPSLGMAVDIGTTNVVIYLADLRSGRLLDRISQRNKQGAFGEDVISRIIYSHRSDGVAQLQKAVVDTINELIAILVQKHRFSAENVLAMVAAGNTTMSHLFLGLPPRSIREAPYIPTATSFPVVKAGDLGLAINPMAPVYTVPAVAAYVGGDTVAGALAAGLDRTDWLTLFLDVGTNGEIVLGNRDWLTTDACSAGPAFEGAGVRCGMRATEGAIEDVRIHSGTLEPTIKVIGDVPPLGICGSGMISLLAEMLITGVVDRGGRLVLDYIRSKTPDHPRARVGEHGPEYVVVWAEETGTGEDIVFTEVDINNIIRVKASIYAGIRVMVEKTGVPIEGIDQVLIGGAFGQHINVEQAIQIGLLPDLPWEKFKFLGNTSAWGAYNILLSKYAREKAEEIASRMTYLELIADNSFMNEFTAALFLPHTDLSQFPSVRELAERSPGG